MFKQTFAKEHFNLPPPPLIHKTNKNTCIQVETLSYPFCRCATLPFLARQNKLLLKAIWQIGAAMRPRKQIKLQFARPQSFRLSPNDDAGDMPEAGAEIS